MVYVKFEGVGGVFWGGGVALADDVEFEDNGVAVGGLVVDCNVVSGWVMDEVKLGDGDNLASGKVCLPVRMSISCGGMLRGIMPRRCAKTSSTMTEVLFHT